MWNPGRPSDLGQFFMAINVAAFDQVDAFKARARDLLKRVKTSPLAEGSSEILIAGEKEQRATATSRTEGIPVEGPVIDTLTALAQRLGVLSPFASKRVMP